MRTVAVRESLIAYVYVYCNRKRRTSRSGVPVVSMPCLARPGPASPRPAKPCCESYSIRIRDSQQKTPDLAIRRSRSLHAVPCLAEPRRAMPDRAVILIAYVYTIRNRKRRTFRSGVPVVSMPRHAKPCPAMPSRAVPRRAPLRFL